MNGFEAKEIRTWFDKSQENSAAWGHTLFEYIKPHRAMVALEQVHVAANLNDISHTAKGINPLGPLIFCEKWPFPGVSIQPAISQEPLDMSNRNIYVF